jgi:hypothetical protein
MYNIAENLSRYGAVEKNADNGFIIYEDATVAIQTPRLTQSISDMTVKYYGNNHGNYSILLRTTDNDLPQQKYIELEVNFEKSEIIIKDFESKQKITVPVELDLEQGNRIFAINDGKHLKIYWDCDEIYNYKTNIPSTEYIIIRTEKNCSLEVTGWEVRYLYQDARYEGALPYYILFE